MGCSPHQIEAKAQKRLAFRADGAGNITHLFLGQAPCLAFVKLRWYETSAFHNAVAGISLLVLLSALVGWPIVAFCLRGRGGPESPPRAARLLAWIVGSSILLFFICRRQEAQILLVPDQLVLELLLQVEALFAGLRQAIDGLTSIGAEGASVIADHVKLHAFGVHRVATKLARHSASRVCNRLFQQGFSS